MVELFAYAGLSGDAGHGIARDNGAKLALDVDMGGMFMVTPTQLLEGTTYRGPRHPGRGQYQGGEMSSLTRNKMK